MYWFQSNFDRLVSRAGATRLRDELSFEEREGMFRKETKSAKGTGLFVAYPLRSYQMDARIAGAVRFRPCHAFFSLELTPLRWHRASSFLLPLFFQRVWLNVAGS